MPATPTQVKVQSLKELQAVIRQFCTERDWDQFHNAKDMALSLVLESAEFLEHFQWRNGEEIDAYLKQHKADAAEELADVFYWVLRIADKLDIDLVVMGSHGHGGLYKAFVGSVSEQLLHESEVPVLIVPDKNKKR